MNLPCLLIRLYHQQQSWPALGGIKQCLSIPSIDQCHTYQYHQMHTIHTYDLSIPYLPFYPYHKQQSWPALGGFQVSTIPINTINTIPSIPINTTNSNHGHGQNLVALNSTYKYHTYQYHQNHTIMHVWFAMST